MRRRSAAGRKNPGVRLMGGKARPHCALGAPMGMQGGRGEKPLAAAGLRPLQLRSRDTPPPGWAGPSV